MTNKIVFLLLAIIALWLLINPNSRDFIKTSVAKVFSPANTAGSGQ